MYTSVSTKTLKVAHAAKWLHIVMWLVITSVVNAVYGRITINLVL